MKTNKTFYISVIILTIINFISFFSVFYSLGKASAKQTFNITNKKAKIQIEVLEENTNKPIDNATVCIIETRHYENTNKYGKTKLIQVPVLRNTNFDISLIRPFGEITILVYKNGYADNISFYNEVLPSSIKYGAKIYMKPIITEEDLSPTISTAHPSKSWAETLIKLYKKTF